MEGFQQSTCVRKATYDFADLVAGLGFSLPRSRWDKGKTFDDTVIIHEKNEITCDMFVWPRQDRIVFFFPSILSISLLLHDVLMRLVLMGVQVPVLERLGWVAPRFLSINSGVHVGIRRAKGKNVHERFETDVLI